MRQKNPQLLEWDKRIGGRWRDARRAAGLTLDDVVEKLGTMSYVTARASIANLESGRCQPMHVLILTMLLCTIYATDPNTILGGKK